MKRKRVNSQQEFEKADSKLNSEIRNPVVNVMILRPNLSDKVLTAAAPVRDPRKSKDEDTVPYIALSHTRSNCDERKKTET